MAEFLMGSACLAAIILLAFSPSFIARVVEQRDTKPVSTDPIQFSLQRLMLSITIIAIGIALVLFAVRSPPSLAGAAAWLAGGTLIGAGLLLPAKASVPGGCIGFLAMLIFGLVVAAAGD